MFAHVVRAPLHLPFFSRDAVALLTRRLDIPYTVGLVIARLLLGATNLITPPHLTKELLFSVFLPGLVFEAAYHLDFQTFWRNKIGINTLAVPGVAAAIGLTTVVLLSLGGVLRIADGFALPHALVFSALIAATDPIAVVALFRSLRVPRRLAMLVEAESLLNDGTAVVFFTLALGLSTGIGAGGAALQFGRAVMVYLVTLGLRRTKEAIPWSWSAVLTWGGLRGGLSMVLALALPGDFPHRKLVLVMTFGVIVLSILLQGLTMAPLLRWLKLGDDRAPAVEDAPPNASR